MGETGVDMVFLKKLKKFEGVKEVKEWGS